MNRIMKYAAVSMYATVFLGLAVKQGYGRGGPEFSREADSMPASQRQVIDLGSAKVWTLSIDGGPDRPIVVPGGGWNSDIQSPGIQVLDDVKDYVTYKRKIAIPAGARGKVVLLKFGGVNYGAEIFLDGRKVGEHHGPMLPFSVDLTGAVTPGSEHRLEVKAYHRRHYIPAAGHYNFKDRNDRRAIVPVGWDFPASKDPKNQAEAKFLSGPWRGWSKHPYGITKYVRLEILPPIYIRDYFFRTSVKRDEFECDVWVRNGGKGNADLVLKGLLSSWNEKKWAYPSLPEIPFRIKAGETKKLRIGPVKWRLGRESLWWPNIPFREGYTAQLHWLNLSLWEGKSPVLARRFRFGFVEHSEGKYYYMVNGVRYTGFSDGTAEAQMSDYDGYSRTPAFLPPTKAGTGCPETWKRYMRLGFRMSRLHCSPPTDYMMKAADEVGFMLIPEAPIWGNYFSSFHPVYTLQAIRELGLLCRNHPSVARYSLANELRGPLDPWRPMIDAMTKTDPTRPLTFELHKQGHGKIEGVECGHAWKMEHYSRIGPVSGMIRGEGEFLWKINGFSMLPDYVIRMRMLDWAYMAPWSLLNYWPNFLEGTSFKTLAWRRIHRDRVDGIDGWGSPIVKAVQRAFHPYLLVDHGIRRLNHHYGAGWPKRVPTVHPGRFIKRKIEVFNNGLMGSNMELRWEARLDSSKGRKAAGGKQEFVVTPGFHTTRIIKFLCPRVGEGRKVYLLLSSLLEHKEVFREERIYFLVEKRKNL